MKGTLPGIEETLGIPDKRYFTIGEVAELCGLKTHVLRYWETEFPQLNPVKRRGNRRYYQRDDVLVVRTIQHLVHEEGFTLAGARQQLQKLKGSSAQRKAEPLAAKQVRENPAGQPVPTPQEALPPESIPRDFSSYFEQVNARAQQADQASTPAPAPAATGPDPGQLKAWRKALEEARNLLD